MTRKRWLIGIGAVALALAVTLLAIDPSSEAEGNPGIVAWEFAWSEERAAEILADWGDEGQDAARLSLRLDFLYLLAYGAFFALACAATRDLAAGRGWGRMAAFGAWPWCAGDRRRAVRRARGRLPAGRPGGRGRRRGAAAGRDLRRASSSPAGGGRRSTSWPGWRCASGTAFAPARTNQRLSSSMPRP